MCEKGAAKPSEWAGGEEEEGLKWMKRTRGGGLLRCLARVQRRADPSLGLHILTFMRGDGFADARGHPGTLSRSKLDVDAVCCVWCVWCVRVCVFVCSALCLAFFLCCQTL